MNILDKAIVLKLNRAWQPIGQRTVRQAICDLLGGDHGERPALAMDISYAVDASGDFDLEQPLGYVPVAWERWLELPVRDCDLSLGMRLQRVRVPTVIVATSYAGMPLWRPALSRRSIYDRDGGICQYTGRKVNWDKGNLDHVVPRSRGGGNSFENLVWSDKSVNSKKADRLPEEAGLRLLRKPTAPKTLPIFKRIRKVNHRDWKWFLKH